MREEKIWNTYFIFLIENLRIIINKKIKKFEEFHT